MAVITEGSFLHDLKSNKIGKLYFIFGEEKYMVQSYTEKLEEKALGCNKNDFNYKKVTEFNFNLEDISNFVESAPFLSEKKFLKIIDFKTDILTKNDFLYFKEILKKLPDYIICVISQYNEDVNLKSSAWYSFYKFFEKNAAVLKLERLSDYNLERILEKWSNIERSNLDQSTFAKIVEYCPKNLLNLHTEFVKINAYSFNNNILNEDIEKIVFFSEEANVFELTKSIEKKDLKSALKRLNLLILKKIDPSFILNIISSFYLDVYRVKVFSIYNKPIKTVCEYFNYKGKEFKLEKAQRYCKNIDLKKIKSTLKLITDADFKLKTTGINKKIILQQLLVKIMFKN